MKTCLHMLKIPFRPLRAALIITLLLTAMTLHAQEEDETDVVTDMDIRYDALVEDTITERSFFDLFRFNGTRGQVIQVEMIASGGLAPLIGISSTGADIIARSDIAPDGSILPEAEPNSTALLEYEIPETGQYAIVATRVGNAEGTTTGAYTLILRLSENVNAPFEMPGSQQVTFRCGRDIATSALTIDFIAESTVDTYRISVFSPDNFTPVVDAIAGSELELSDCTGDTQDMTGNTFILPDGETYTLESDEAADYPQAAQLGLRGGAMLDAVRATIGSVEGRAGRYVVVIDGLVINSAQEIDFFEFRLGPLAAQSGEVLVYMVAGENTRIDPLMWIESQFDEEPVRCDDAGLRDCTDVPAFTGYGVQFHDGTSYIGSRFSAGMRIAPGNTEATRIVFSSRARNATGPYAIIILGELPERTGGE